MFTGIISHTTNVRVSNSTDAGKTLTFDRPTGWDDVAEGESVDVNGICLTITAIRPNEYDCFVVPETLHRTSFGTSIPPRVNLERALKLNDRLSGHFVQGHVDGVGTIKSISQEDGLRISLDFDPINRSLVIEKGSITIDGVSLTVASVTDNNFEIAIIPYTVQHTTFKELQVGQIVNLEFDVIGKYVTNNMKATSQPN